MKLTQVASGKEASQKTGAQVFDALTVEQAIDMMKRSCPDLVPHTCLWHPFTDKINRYYFMFGGER